MIRCDLLSSPPPPLPSSNPNPSSLHRNPTLVLCPKLSSPLSRCGARRSSSFCRVTGGDGGGSSSGDENAEPIRAGRFKFRDGSRRGGDQDEGNPWRSKKRRWWSDDSQIDVDEDFEDFDDDPTDPWDMIWIFKVFKSYGYFLPAIIVSMLLTTGPKAFLLALALPLGQSAISLAIDKVWGKAEDGPRTKTKARKREFTRSNWGFGRRWQDQGSEDEEGNNGYQSWVSTDTGVTGATTSGTSLGGWDELDIHGRGNTNGYARRQREGPSKKDLSQFKPTRKGKLSKRGRYKDEPLLLRLLIAIFPFLASWTRIL
ncbi:uncharacterized protein LOC122007823 [Zingiber officinale]|nr:uncharacterized protein LOC122007823 [Zingiber officinale]